MSEDLVVQEPNEDEYKEWLANPVTRYVYSVLQQNRENVKEFLCNGGSLNPKSPMTTDFLVGRIQGNNDFLEMKYEEPKQYGH